MRNNEVEVFYINELISTLEAARTLRPVKDVGNLRDSQQPIIGMDKINAKSRIGKYFVNFANGSSIHGLNHLAAPRRHPVEKFLAVLFILGALLCLIFLALDSWYRYQHETTMLILEYDFRKFKVFKPSCFVCPEITVDYDKFPAVFKKYNIDDTNSTRHFFEALSSFDYENIPQLDLSFKAVPPELWLKILYEVRYEIKMSETDYEWVVTEKGLCKVRNNFVNIYLRPELWFTNNWTNIIVTIPRDEKYTLRYVSSTKLPSVKSTSQNYWAYIQYPGSVMEYTSPGIFVKRLKVTSLNLEIMEVSSTEKVKLLSVKQRNCKYLEDGGLKMWPIYTSQYCQIECRFYLIKKFCGCFPHVAPPTDGTKICNVQDLLCVHKNLKKYVPLDIGTLKKCGCLKDCDSVTYTDKGIDTIDLKPGSPDEGIMNIEIEFPKERFLREELFGYNDFLTSVGGAAGLFLGASVVSFVEIFYILTLRFFWYHKRYEKVNAKRND